MKTSTKILLTLMLPISFICNGLQAQNIFPSTGAAGIGTTSPDASSLLEIKSTAKGLLIPRVTKAQRDAIAAPATGLMIFQTNSMPGFYYYSGTAWTAVSPKGVNKSLSNLTAPTAVNQSLLPATSATIDLGSSSYLWKNAWFSGDANINGLTIGLGAGSVSSNTAIGNGALISNTTGNSNTATGAATLNYNTTGYYNTANGYRALFVNNTGYANTANGAIALYNNTTGNSNTASGYAALYSNTMGYDNTASGYRALYFNTAGYFNTANGYESLYSSTTSTNNTANGYQALYSDTSGYDNAAYGSQALYNNTSGHENTAYGRIALLLNSIGYGNTAAGYGALFTNSSGYNNTAVGFGADVTNSNFFNATAIGYYAKVDGSNKVLVGNTAVTTIGGYTGWTTYPSDSRFKKNVKENVPGLAFITKLKPITYTMDIDAIDARLQPEGQNNLSNDKKMSADEKLAKDAKSKMVYTGFIAQDVEKAAKSLNYDFSGVDAPKNKNDFYGLRYADFVVPLVKAVQELDESQKSEVKSQNEEIAKLSAALLAEKSQNDVQQKINDDLQRQITELKAMIVSGNQQAQTNNQHVTISSPLGVGASSLFQNIPNPFNHTTTINYTLPQTYLSAKIIVVDKGGKVLKEINITTKGKGSLNIDASALASAAYQYSLYVDGKLIDTKQMILSK